MEPERGRLGGRVSMEQSDARRLSLEITRRSDISSGSGNLFF
jgi:hypothetical protein